MKIMYKKLPAGMNHFFPLMMVALFWLGLNNVQAQNYDCGSASNVINSYPFLDDFDGSASGAPATWSDVNYDDDDFETNGSSSFETGPEDEKGHGGNGSLSSSSNYLNTESSSLDEGEIVVLESPCMDLSNLGCYPQFSFWYHMYSDDPPEMGTLEVQINDGSGWTTLWSVSGPQQTSETDLWKNAVLDLSDYAKETVKLRMYTIDGGDSYKGDICLDDLEVRENPNGGTGIANDVGVSSILSPVQNDAPYGIENLSLTVANFSGSTIPSGTTIPVSYQTSIMDNPKTIPYTLQSDLECSRDIDLGGISLACNGNINLSAWTDLNSDGNNSNDTSSVSYLNPLLKYSDSLTVCQTADGENIDVSFENTQVPSGPLEIRFYGTGDFNSSTEYLQLRDENNNVIQGSEISGNQNPSGSYCAQGDNCGQYNVNNQNVTLTIPQNTAAQWASDGKMDFTIDFSSGADYEYCGQAWLAIEYTLPGDSNVQGPTNLSVGWPDTAYVNSPYAFNGGTSEMPFNQWFVNGNQIAVDTNNIEHAFSDIGTDTVMLVSAGCYGIDTTVKQIEVVNPPSSPSANFFAVSNYVDTGEVVELKDLSEVGPTNWEWSVQPATVDNVSSYSFVNSNKNSRNPSIKFTKSGIYDVSLIASNSQGSDKLVKSKYIFVNKGHLICGNTSTSSQAMGNLYDPVGKDSTFTDGDGGPRNCQFLIQPNCADEVSLTMETFNMVSDLCAANVAPNTIKIYDGATTNAPALHDQAGYPNGFTNGNVPSRPFKVTAKSGTMLITYATNGCDNAADFEARWETNQSADSLSKSIISNSTLEGPDSVYANSFGTFYVSNHLAGTDYRWNYYNRTATGSDSSQSISFNADTGWQTIQLVSEYCGYVDTSEKDVYVREVNQSPVANYTASSKKFKAGDTIQLFDKSSFGPSNFEWSIQPSGSVSFVKGTDSNSRNPYITISNSGFYRVDLVVSNSAGQDVKAELNYLEVVQPCQPVSNSDNSDYAINEFSISRIGSTNSYTNVTSFGNNGYSMFVPNPALELEAGQQYEVEFKRNTSFNDIAYGIWLDLNNDGNFDSNEELLAKPIFSGNSYKDTISIPASVNQDLTTVLRIASNKGGATLNGCGSIPAGEFEDYQVELFKDRTAPLISLKRGDTITRNICDPAVTDTGATAFDAVDGNLSGKIELQNSGSLYTVGINDLVYKVSDGSGNIAQKVQTVIVVGPDTTAPSITLNGSDAMEVQVFNEFEEPGFNAQDVCGNVESVTVEGTVKSDIIGRYLLKYKAMDFNGNNSLKTRVVNVVDSVSPQVNLLGKDTMRLPVYEFFEDPGIQAQDNYYDSTSINVEGSVNPNQVGTYQLVYKVTDPYGNLTTVRRVVIVEDNEAPQFYDTKQVVEHPVDTPFTMPFRVKDNYSGMDKLNIIRQGSFFTHFANGVPDSIGVFNANVIVEDGSGNRNSFNFSVQVVDLIDPVLELNEDQIVRLQRWEEYQDTRGITYTVSDNYYDNEDLNIQRTGSYFSNYVARGYPEGLYEIRYKVADPSGNESKVHSRGVRIFNNTGIDGNTEGQEVSVDIYPNPSNGQFKIDVRMNKSQDIKIDVMNAQGKQVETIVDLHQSEGGIFQADLNDIADGLYQIRIQTGSEVITKSMILNQ